jgi:hypothetical protein
MEKKRRRSFVRIRRSGEPRPGAPLSDADSPREEDGAVQAEGAEPGDRTRIVIPRQERGGPDRPEQDIELREVRYGQASRGPYLRVVPRQRRFTRVGPALEGRRWPGPVETLGPLAAQGQSSAALRDVPGIHERLTNQGASCLLLKRGVLPAPTPRKRD